MGDHHETPWQAVRAEALETLLVQKGLIESEQVDKFVKKYEEQVGPMIGANMVARAWCDHAYKQQLLTDAKSALQEAGADGGEAQQLEVVENTPDVHNVVVCTLCSCYPWAVLGLPPTWYKQPAYRSRIVKEPKTVLREFGVDISNEVEVRVWDSSAEVRYLVLPERPAGTENLTEPELAALVTRDTMIGVAKVNAPNA